MNKIINCRIVSKLHRHKESDCITLVTKRHFLVVWFFGLCLSFSFNYSPIN